MNPANPFLPYAIKASDVKKINDVWVECDGEYMSTNLSTAYKNVKSSVGIVCEVVLKNGSIVNCYVFNNEDNHRIVWKETK